MTSEVISLTPRGSLFRSLSHDLRCMRQRSIDTEEERDAWYAEVQRFRVKLGMTYASIYDSLPHELEHYLDDADIRAKDFGYRKKQEEFMDDLLGFISAEIQKERLKEPNKSPEPMPLKRHGSP